MRRVPVFLLAFLPFSAHAVVDTISTIDPGTADSNYAWVGQINGCSAVAIGPRTILTASHVGNGDFSLGGNLYRLASGLAAPKISGKVIDLRAIQLSSNLPGWYELGTSAPTNAAVTMVGYGGAGVVNAKGSGYNLRTGGVRRAGGNIISGHQTFTGRGPSLTSMLDQAGDSVLAGGDSGGGWFVQGKLVGISSFVFTKSSGKANYGWAKKAYFGSGAIDLTNTKVANWVRSQIAPPLAGAVNRGAVPEPSTWAVLGLGCWGVWRRKRAR